MFYNRIFEVNHVAFDGIATENLMESFLHNATNNQMRHLPRFVAENFPIDGRFSGRYNQALIRTKIQLKYFFID